MIDQPVLRSKSGPSAFHLHFLLPQVDSPALFAPTSEIKDVFKVKNRLFLVRKNNVKKVVEMSLQVNICGAYCFHDERHEQHKHHDKKLRHHMQRAGIRQNTSHRWLRN